MHEHMIQTELYLFRNALTVGEADPDGEYPRSTQDFLAEAGKQQSEKLGCYLVDAGVKPSRIYCSPEPHCIETAFEAALAANYSELIDMDCALQDLTEGKDESYMKQWSNKILQESDIASGTEQVLAFVGSDAIKQMAVDVLRWPYAAKRELEIGSASLNLFIHNGRSWQVADLSRTT